MFSDKDTLKRSLTYLKGSRIILPKVISNSR